MSSPDDLGLSPQPEKAIRITDKADLVPGRQILTNLLGEEVIHIVVERPRFEDTVTLQDPRKIVRIHTLAGLGLMKTNTTEL